ncbi:PREDICTED: uncharacterized protein LOC105150796 [Acromyrmex echinatior]|uniref:uncharacterized protein LOC105150796 n=1 Tax=Acromyrmex echinatior TaxID=103372 RepID=UPI000580F1B6|nr:PREDICTED: uncharacterized protein LOC105150796 [Acromyrmex echinatior]
MRTIYFLAIISVLVILHEVESGLYGSKQNTKHYKTNQKLTELAANKNQSQPLPGRKMIVSAWGIIGIIIGAIIFSTITYYIFLLYPYICKKDTSYDIIELADVNSVSTVSDNVNVNNVPRPLRAFCESNDVSNDISNDAPLKR